MKTIVSLLFLISAYSFPQQVANWNNYSDMKNVSSVFGLPGSFIAASNGGGFQYFFSQNDFKKFTKADGLSGIELISVTVDKYGKIWFGSSTGVIDVIDPENGT